LAKTATPKAERKHAADYVTDCLADAARAPSSRRSRFQAAVQVRLTVGTFGLGKVGYHAGGLAACLRVKYSTTPEISPRIKCSSLRFKCSATSLVRRDRQKVEEEREGLRGEPRFGGASSFAGLGVPFLSGHVADLYGFFAWR
jgi:hypothetical protein